MIRRQFLPFANPSIVDRSRRERNSKQTGEGLANHHRSEDLAPVTKLVPLKNGSFSLLISGPTVRYSSIGTHG